jgi:RNA polymerase sigma-70 factor (ECF subfamily)
MAACDDFLAALPPALKAEACARPAGDLAVICARLVADARAANPSVALEEGRFLAHLAARLPGDRTLDAALAVVRSADLYLAAACALGSTAALALFDRTCLTPLRGVLARLAAPGADADDLAQLVRARLLAPDARGHRRVADYAGLGSLRRWVRTAAVRLALNEGRGPRELAISDEELAARLPDGRDAELSYLKAHYRPAFAVALRESLDALAAADQNLLRQRYVDGLSLEELGSLHGVHRATALRRLERARLALIGDLRARLRERLKLDSGELESLLRLVASRIDVTLGQAR